MSSTFGEIFKLMSWGESHGKGIGVTVDGCPPHISLSEEDIQKDLDKRKPGQSHVTTTRKESDTIEILSGVFEGKTTGTPIAMMVRNEDQRSKNYDDIKDLFRPGHADFTYQEKYGIRDYRGGGRSSGRETVARVAAGAIAKKILEKENIKIYAYTKSIGNIGSQAVNYDEIYNNVVRTADKEAAAKMEELIVQVRKEQSSIGGVVEVVALNVPTGLGEPTFDKLDADIAKALISIGAVKGIEFGDGFELTKMRGEEANDIFVNNNGRIKTESNHAGGILGGISNGMPIIARVAIKPTASLSLEQRTVDIHGNSCVISTKGRHDPCIVPRVVPVIESMMAIVLCDHYLRQKTLQ